MVIQNSKIFNAENLLDVYRNRTYETIYKIFPFVPRVAWKIVRGKFILPKISAPAWNYLTNNRDLVVLAHGGILETVFSFTILEALKKICPENNLYWAGNPIYNNLVEYHGLAQIKETPANYRYRFPTPIFQDLNYTYFNCLTDYKWQKSFDLLHRKKDVKSLIKQIFYKSCLPWETKYFTKWRNLDKGSLEIWCRETRFNPERPFIMIFPDDLHSLHQLAKELCLRWEAEDVKEFVRMSFGLGWQVLVISDQPQKYYTPNLWILPYNFAYIFSLLPKAKLIMSRQIDWNLLGLMLSDGVVLSTPQIYAYNLFRAEAFLGKENKVGYMRGLSPANIVERIKNYDSFLNDGNLQSSQFNPTNSD